MKSLRHVAIVGGGFTGTLQAINLLRHDGPAATLIERAGHVGDGLAYGAAAPSHLLNVRAANMSAFPDDPGHFVRWLEARGVAASVAAFAPRLHYGAYLRELLNQAAQSAGGRLRIVQGEVIDALPQHDGIRLALADGKAVEADAAVLAVGNLPPHDPPGLPCGGLPGGIYQPDPWNPAVAQGLGPDDEVLLLGSGLTTVDVSLLLDASGFRGRITALSRRGLSPRVHAPATSPGKQLDTCPDTRASTLLHAVRTRAGEIGWRNAVDELRPFTQTMWARATPEQRTRFLRHLRPWWDVHRHRIAPPVAERLAALRAEGRLRVLAGHTLAFEAEAGGVEMTWRPRGSDVVTRMRVARVVNCTGPMGDLALTDDPLLARLRDRGLIRPDPQHLGIDVDTGARAIAADGTASDRLFALGSMTRGAFWEIVAVPDIRAQTWTLARRLSDAHWVGGEGL